MHTAFGDPDYGYLLNSLLILEGRAPVHVDHPGTTVQILGALVIRVAYLFQNSTYDLVDSVLLYPYFYLYWISTALVVVLALSVLYFGRNLSRSGHPWWIVLASQSAPLLLPPSWIYLTRVCPEILTVAFAILVAALVIPFDRQPWRFRKTVLVGIALGAGIASKINFLPLVALLILSRSPRNIFIGFGACLASFAFFTFPIWSEYQRLLGWLTGIFFHSRNYGLGAPGIIPTGETIHRNFFFLWDNIRAYFFLLLLIPLALINSVLERKRPFDLWPYLVTTLILLVQFLMVLKQVAERYLLPTVAIWAVLISQVLHLPNKVTTRAIALGIALVIVSAALQEGFSKWWQIASSYPYAEISARELNDKAATISGCGTIYAPVVSAIEFPLYSGDLATNGYFTPRLQRLYPDTIFYDIYPGQFRSFAQPLKLEEVKSIVAKKKCYLLRASKQILAKEIRFMNGTKAEYLGEVKHPFQLTPILEKMFEGLYRIEKIY